MAVSAGNARSIAHAATSRRRPHELTLRLDTLDVGCSAGVSTRSENCFDGILQLCTVHMKTTIPSSQRLSPRPRRVFVLGATGTIGRATVRALVQSGHEVVCLVRPRRKAGGGLEAADGPKFLEGAIVRWGDVTDRASLDRDGIRGEHFDALVSCLASRTGAPRDAWAIDYRAHVDALTAAKACGVSQMVLVSAICVQKPLLEFQHAKLAFEKVLQDSGLTFSIVRPTAFFKSLSGQIGRLKQGKPYLLFGDGNITACKPISDDDLGRFLCECLDDESRHNRILPIGGPGPAITPRQQGECLFALLKREPRYRHVPLALLDTIVWGFGTLSHVAPRIAEKAELARIARYYATESMLVLNPATGRYDEDQTPSTGTETLFDFYAHAVKGTASAPRGEHAIF